MSGWDSEYQCSCGQRHYGRTHATPPPDSDCRECHNATQAAEYISEEYVRCPKCRGRTGELWDMGFDRSECQEVICSHCDHEYTIKVEYTVTYTSPPWEAKIPTEPGRYRLTYLQHGTTADATRTNLGNWHPDDEEDALTDVEMQVHANEHAATGHPIQFERLGDLPDNGIPTEPGVYLMRRTPKHEFHMAALRPVWNRDTLADEPIWHTLDARLHPGFGVPRHTPAEFANEYAEFQFQRVEWNEDK